MMKVLVPVEDPLFAAAMVQLISQHKWPAGSQFIVVHIVEPHLLNESVHLTLGGLIETNQKELIANATKLVNSVAQAINNSHPDAIVSQEVVQAHVKEQIIRMAAQWKADLVIVGTHGRSGFNRFLLGSVSLALTSELKVPMLLVRPDAATLELWTGLDQASISYQSIDGYLAKKGEKALRRVLVALDDTTLSHQLIDFVDHHNWNEKTEILLLSVVDSAVCSFLPTEKAKKLYDEFAFISETRLHDFRRTFEAESNKYEINTLVCNGRPQASILETAKDWNADLIVVGCHYRSALGRFLLGSVSLPILCKASCSVLLIKEQQ
jgi:nucleotide-binding universal stress UspA family protein